MAALYGRNGRSPPGPAATPLRKGAVVGATKWRLAPAGGLLTLYLD